MNRNQRQLARARADLDVLIERGQLIYQTYSQVVDLRNTVRAWIDALGVEVVFDPDTPPDLRDYFAGATVGAIKGAFVGALIGLFVGALLDEPGAGAATGAGLGATAGAAGGLSAVGRGYRVRINARRTANGVAALVELA